MRKKNCWFFFISCPISLIFWGGPLFIYALSSVCYMLYHKNLHNLSSSPFFLHFLLYFILPFSAIKQFSARRPTIKIKVITEWFILVHWVILVNDLWKRMKLDTGCWCKKKCFWGGSLHQSKIGVNTYSEYFDLFRGKDINCFPKLSRMIPEA